MPQTPPPQIPVVSYPTPQIIDRVLVEEVDSRLGEYKALQPGQPHPDTVNYSGFVFVHQRPSRAEAWVQRFYVNTRSNQNTYNASTAYDAESNSHPIFTRSYIYRRDSYTAATKSAALTGVVGVLVTNGGSGYTTAPTVTFTGGAGSGATATAIIFRGVVMGVIITSEGTGYTSAPTVGFTGGGGSGAAATAQIQPTTAVLTEETAQRLEGDPMDSLFIRVTRVYQTLPGATVTSWEIYYKGGYLKKTTVRFVAASTTPTAGVASQLKTQIEGLTSVVAREIIESVTDSSGVAVSTIPPKTRTKWYPRERVVATITFRVVPADTAEPVEGAAFGTGKVYSSAGGGTWTTATAYVCDCETREIEGSDKELQIIEAIPIPPTRYEYEEEGHQFPAIFSFLGMWNSATDPEGAQPHPWLGIDYEFEDYRDASAACRVKYQYSLGAPVGFPENFSVRSPGSSSAYWPIKSNTIHPAVSIAIDDGSGSGPVLVEEIPASTPATYSRTDILLIASSSVPWKGLIYENVTKEISESRDPATFPP